MAFEYKCGKFQPWNVSILFMYSNYEGPWCQTWASWCSFKLLLQGSTQPTGPWVLFQLVWALPHSLRTSSTGLLSGPVSTVFFPTSSKYLCVSYIPPFFLPVSSLSFRLQLQCNLVKSSQIPQTEDLDDRCPQCSRLIFHNAPGFGISILMFVFPSGFEFQIGALSSTALPPSAYYQTLGKYLFTQ